MTRKAAFAPTLPGTALLAAIIAPLPLWAQQGDPDTVQLDPVVITGGLTPIAADAYGRAHTVLTADEIERRGLRTVQDALRIVPGVAVSSAGASQTQVRIRGAEGNHTLILIDGVPATGSPWWVDSLDVGDGETFEIAFLADNPGVWMDHCHNLPHAREGLMTHLMYNGVDTAFLLGRRSGNEPE